MSPKKALLIAGILYLCLGVMVWSVLWLAPEVGVPLAKESSHPQNMITTARGWGDINGTLFCGLGLILLLCSRSDHTQGSQEVIARILLGNSILATVLLCMATFHTVILHHGPPPPVFLVCFISVLVSLLGRKSISNS